MEFQKPAYPVVFFAVRFFVDFLAAAPFAPPLPLPFALPAMILISVN